MCRHRRNDGELNGGDWGGYEHRVDPEKAAQGAQKPFGRDMTSHLNN
jgi:hypothetical protein